MQMPYLATGTSLITGTLSPKHEISWTDWAYVPRIRVKPATPVEGEDMCERQRTYGDDPFADVNLVEEPRPKCRRRREEEGRLHREAFLHASTTSNPTHTYMDDEIPADFAGGGPNYDAAPYYVESGSDFDTDEENENGEEVWWIPKSTSAAERNVMTFLASASTSLQRSVERDRKRETRSWKFELERLLLERDTPVLRLERGVVFERRRVDERARWAASLREWWEEKGPDRTVLILDMEAVMRGRLERKAQRKADKFILSFKDASLRKSRMERNLTKEESSMDLSLETAAVLTAAALGKSMEERLQDEGVMDVLEQAVASEMVEKRVVRPRAASKPLLVTG